jgi:hypothetical protein
MHRQAAFRVCLVLVLTGAFACTNDDNFNEIEADDQCTSACDDWEDCVGQQFDVVECRQRCFEAADDDLVDTDTIDACSDCLDDAGDQCAASCIDVCTDAFVAGPQ